MRTLAFDGRTGASGDMLLGALLDAGADPAVLDPVNATLDVRFDIDAVTRCGVTATAVAVRRSDGEPIEGGSGHRRYPDVVDLIESMGLPGTAEADALGAVERLGRAEAAVHGTDLADTRFHAVGADDAISDVTGVALLVADVDPERVVTTPVAAGGGEVTTEHGTYPVPPPAVVELAADADWELRGGPVDEELLTPTGAALLAELAEGVAALPRMAVEAVGLGAGDRDLGDRPNVVRAVVGEAAGTLVRDEVTVLETNVDDATPETLGGLQESLAAAGARDVAVLPATMKKARPGHLVKVVTDPANAERVARRLAAETGTLGVREVGAGHRWIARRRFATATLSGDGRPEVAVKIASDDAGDVFDVSAEYDDAAAAARTVGQPVREVARRAETAVRQGGALEDVLYHVADAGEWHAADDVYEPSSFEDEGFIRLSTATRVVEVARADHGDADAPLLLAVDRARIEDDLTYEETPSGAFAHLYGPLETAAVRSVVELPRDPDGRYRRPEALDDG